MARGRSPTKRGVGSPLKNDRGTSKSGSPKKDRSKSKSKSKSPSKHRHHDGTKEKMTKSNQKEDEQNKQMYRDKNGDRHHSRSRSPHKSHHSQKYTETLSKKQVESMTKAIDEDDLEREYQQIKARYIKSKSHYFGQIVGNIMLPPTLYEDLTKHEGGLSNTRFDINEYVDSIEKQVKNKNKKKANKNLQGKSLRAILWPTMSTDLCNILILLSSIISIQHLCVFEQICQYQNNNQYIRDIDPGIPKTSGVLIFPMACVFCIILLPSTYFSSARSVHWKWNMSVVGLSTFLSLTCMVGAILLLIKTEDKYRDELRQNISSSWEIFPRSVKNYYVNVDAIVERQTSTLMYTGLWALEYAFVALLIAIVQYKKMHYKLSWGNLAK